MESFIGFGYIPTGSINFPVLQKSRKTELEGTFGSDEPVLDGKSRSEECELVSIVRTSYVVMGAVHLLLDVALGIVVMESVAIRAGVTEWMPDGFRRESGRQRFITQFQNSAPIVEFPDDECLWPIDT